MFRFNFATADADCDRVDAHVEPSVPLAVHGFQIADVHFDKGRKEKLKSLTYLDTREECDGKYSLVPKVYEGGLEVWECTADVLAYMQDTKNFFVNKNVADIGCGCGLLGIYAMKLGAKHVTFQDFNFEIFDKSLFPNIMLNLSVVDGKVEERSKFISADWNDLSLSAVIGEVDVILTSETIYDETNYPALLSLFSRTLTKSGKILLAAKSHYFGVGGSVDAFKSYTAHKFASKTLSTNKSFGVSRQIVEFSWM